MDVKAVGDLQKLNKVVKSCIKLNQLEVACSMRNAYIKKYPWVWDKVVDSIDSLIIDKRESLKPLKPKFDYNYC